MKLEFFSTEFGKIFKYQFVLNSFMFQADRRTDMMKLAVTIRNFAKAPRNGLSKSLRLKKQQLVRGAKPRYVVLSEISDCKIMPGYLKSF